MKLYHGTSIETSPFTMYFTPNIDEAKEFALGLLDCGYYNEESYIYEIEIDETQVSREDDFEVFDSLAYDNPDLIGYSNIVYNQKSGWYIVKSPSLRLVEHYKNQL